MERQAGCSTADGKKAPQRVIKTAQQIIGTQLPSLEDIYRTRCLRRGHKHSQGRLSSSQPPPHSAALLCCILRICCRVCVYTRLLLSQQVYPFLCSTGKKRKKLKLIKVFNHLPRAWFVFSMCRQHLWKSIRQLHAYWSLSRKWQRQVNTRRHAGVSSTLRGPWMLAATQLARFEEYI